MTTRATPAILSTFVAAAIFLTYAGWPDYAKAGPGQGTVFGRGIASLMVAPTQQDSPDVASNQPFIYTEIGPGQGTLLVRSAPSLLA
jgi:hypothetical protein